MAARRQCLHVFMTVKLYKLNPSPPARAVMMACEIFNVPVEMVDVNILDGEHQTPEFLKKNPLHTIPVLEDGDLIIHDSHAIVQYLADAYGKNDTWYPKDVKQRALVNQKLFFDSGILFTSLRNVTYAGVIEGERKVPQKKLDAIKEAYGFLEEFLNRSKFLAGDNMTIADLSAFADVTSLQFLVAINPAEYPKTQAWIKEIEKQPFAKKYNEPGLKFIGELINKYLDL